MKSVFGKYSTLAAILLLLSLFAIGCLIPSMGLILGMIFLLFGLVIASYAVFEKYRRAYLQGKISRKVFIRNTSLEIASLLLAMILAALLGRYITDIATRQILNQLTKFIVGILIGLLVGIGTGIFVNRTKESLLGGSSN